MVYGLRLIPEGTLKRVDEATLHLQDGSTAGLTLHTFDDPMVSPATSRRCGDAVGDDAGVGDGGRRRD